MASSKTTTLLLWCATAAVSNTSLVSAASVQTYDFACFGSRIGTTYASRSSTISGGWVGPFSSVVDASNDENPFACAPRGFGVTPKEGGSDITPIWESELSIQTLQNHFFVEDASALSIELWFTPPREPWQEAFPIFTIGQVAPVAGNVDLQGNCEGYDVRISQLDDSRLELSFRDDSPYRTCRGAAIDIPASNPLIDDTALVQLILVLGKEGLSIYINGQAIHEKIRVQFLGTLEKWDPNYRMQLMSNHLNDIRDSTFYPGSIHQLSLYDYAVESQVAALALYHDGIQFIRDAAKLRTAPPVSAPAPSPLPLSGSPTPGSDDDDSEGGVTTLAPVDSTPPVIAGIPTLVSTPNGAYSMPMGRVSPFDMTLQALSSISPEDSDGWWSLKLEILSVTTFGILTVVDGNQKGPIEAGDLFDLELLGTVADGNQEIPIEAGGLFDLELLGSEVPTTEPEALSTLQLSVVYTLQSPSYFNVPRVSVTGEDLGVTPEEFEYRILAIDNLSNDVLSSSATVRQPVYVHHVNTPSTLKTTTQDLKWSDEPFYSPFGNRPLAYFSDSIVLQDQVDLQIDQVRVDVFAFNGTFTINEEHRHLADFDSCRNRDFSAWQCTGRGKNDQIMTFLAYPSNLEAILSDMEYKGYYNEGDELVIRVFDGAGDNCLSQEEHTTYIDGDGRHFFTVYGDDDCQKTQLIFALDPLDGTSVPEVEAGKHFVAVVLILVSSIACFCVSGMITCGLIHTCYRKMAGNGIIIEEAPSSSSSSSSRATEDSIISIATSGHDMDMDMDMDMDIAAGGHATDMEIDMENTVCETV